MDGFIFLNFFSYVLHCVYIVNFAGIVTKKVAVGFQLCSRPDEALSETQEVCP